MSLLSPARRSSAEVRGMGRRRRSVRARVCDGGALEVRTEASPSVDVICRGDVAGVNNRSPAFDLSVWNPDPCASQ